MFISIFYVTNGTKRRLKENGMNDKENAYPLPSAGHGRCDFQSFPKYQSL